MSEAVTYLVIASVFIIGWLLHCLIKRSAAPWTIYVSHSELKAGIYLTVRHARWWTRKTFERRWFSQHGVYWCDLETGEPTGLASRHDQLERMVNAARYRAAELAELAAPRGEP